MIEFFDAHDRAGSTEGLDDDELRSALLAAHPDKSDMVTKEAIDFVKSVADVSKNNVIDKNEIIAAVQAYTTYIDRKDEVRYPRTFNLVCYLGGMSPDQQSATKIRHKPRW